MTPRILAGAPALDRRAFPRPGSVARWFEPFHVRQPQVARGEISAQVAAGADIVVAPAWLTHRRALEGVGESRRARAWTGSGVRIAREAVEAGLEHRETGTHDTRPVLVAGPLPDVTAGPEHATGRLLPAAASEERDTHDQAGILADAGVDLLLLEPRVSFDATLHVTGVAVPAGRPVWPTITLTDGPGEAPLAERMAMLAAAGAEGVLVGLRGATDPSAIAELLGSAMAGTPKLVVGLVADQPPLAAVDADLDAWLGAGVQLLGLAAGADPAALRPLADARERLLAVARDRQDAERSSLGAWVADAARRAPGGRALWLGHPGIEPPAGFDWTFLDPTDTSAVAALPGDSFRLVVAVTDERPEHLGRLVERGGIVALQMGPGEGDDRPGRLAAVGLRMQDLVATPDGRVRIICRREDA